MFHLTVALAILPAYYFFGVSLKLLLIPYALYLLSQRSSALFPALLIHFLPGSIVSFVILIGCVVITAVSRFDLRHVRLSALFLCSVIPLPLLGSIGVHNLLANEADIVEVVNHMAIYLGLFPFFYGILISADYESKVGERVLWILAGAALFQMSGFYTGSIRYVTLAFPIFFCLLLYTIIGRTPLNVPAPIRLFSLVVCFALGTRLINSSFTSMLIIVSSLILLWGFLKLRNLSRSISWGSTLSVAGLIFTIYLVGYAGDTVFGRAERKTIDDVESFSDILPALQFKAFGDRKPLWDNAWNVIKRDSHIFPPSEPSVMTYSTNAGEEEITFGAHNIGLELLRNYGFLVGIIAIAVYASVFGYLGSIARSGLHDPLLVIFGISCLATGIFGGLLGHFVLVSHFSFLLMGLSGLVYGVAMKTNNKIF